VRIAFLGTSPFACPALAALVERHDVALVVTQPDRPVGRHATLTAPPVKQAAERLGLPVFQPEQIGREEATARLRDVGADVLVVAAYGQLLKPPAFTAAPLGAINIHASLLPAYRGAAPVQWAIIRGETQTGITTFRIDAGMDTGDLILRRSLEIGPDETAGELEGRLASLGATTIVETLDGLADGSLVVRAQPEDGVSMAPRMNRETGHIDWGLPSQRIHDLTRGTNPWPGAWTVLEGERVKIHRTIQTDIACGPISSGEIALRETDRLLIGTGDRLIEIREIQREGRPRVDGPAFLHGLRSPARFS